MLLIMVYRPAIQNDRCFVLLPLKAPFIGYFEKIIKPAAAEVGLRAVKADDIYGTRSVIRDIWELIWQSKVVIAIVTDKNPNVNYELGICHTLGIPTVLVTARDEDVPFDYRQHRYIPYKTDEAGWEQKLREALMETLKSVLAAVSLDEELPWPYDTYIWKEQKRIGSLIESQDALDGVLEGVDLVFRSISLAFGPNGNEISVASTLGPASPQRRGILIAKAIKGNDPLESRGIEQMQRLAAEMQSSVGDGTKTAVILARAMLKVSHAALRKGYLPKNIVAGMRSATDTAVAHILTQAKSCEGEKVYQVALTASGQKNLAWMVVEAMKKTGKDGVITIEESKGEESVLEIIEGLHFDTGFISDAFATDTVRQECILQDCYVLIYEPKIQSMKDLLPLLELVAKADKPLLMICGDLEGEALATVVLNKERGILSCVAVRTAGFGDRRHAILEDIAVVTGARALIRERIIPLQNVRLEDLGHAKKVEVTRQATTILGGGGKQTLVEARIRELRQRIEQTTSDYDREKLQERLAKLASGIAVIKIGERTETDRAESLYRAQSAMFSAHAAIENGYVVGGGIQYFRAKPFVEKLVAKNQEEQAGIDAVASALEAPLRQLLINSRVSSPERVLAAIKDGSSNDFGFNVDTATVEDLRLAGVVDPAKTLKEALLFAFSYSRGIIQTGAWDLASPE
jgi:chaperonin GroEL